MVILLATHNKNKITEIKKALENTGHDILTLNDITEMPEVIEDGETLEDNSLKKAKEIFEYSGITTMADDTGLEVEILDGEPGVYSARWAGENSTYEENNRKMLKRLEGVPFEKRKAVFRCVITLYGNNIHEVSVGELRGRITNEPKGEKGFGYDPIFVPEGFDRTLAEMPLKSKDLISHRGKAVKRMTGIISNMNNLDHK
ncbi:MAG: RdgB/HAM1 family non-canonical purine NTP pyrophosphatase [Candidatus Delongbacteria bacterium]